MRIPIPVGQTTQQMTVSGFSGVVVVPTAPTNAEETFTSASDTFTLAAGPITGSVVVFRNGKMETGWTLNGTSLVLASPLDGTNDTLTVRYEH